MNEWTSYSAARKTEKKLKITDYFVVDFQVSNQMLIDAN